MIMDPHNMSRSSHSCGSVESSFCNKTTNLLGRLVLLTCRKFTNVKTFNSCQAAQTEQANIGQYFSL